MTRTRRLAAAYIALAAAVAVLFVLNLFWGSVSLAPGAVLTALLGKGGDALAGNIILQLRLPRAVMAALLGAASARQAICCRLFCKPHCRAICYGRFQRRKAGGGPDHGGVSGPRDADQLGHDDRGCLCGCHGFHGLCAGGGPAGAAHEYSGHLRCDDRLYLLRHHRYRGGLCAGFQHRQSAQLVAGQLFRRDMGQCAGCGTGGAACAGGILSAFQAHGRLPDGRGVRPQRGRECQAFLGSAGAAIQPAGGLRHRLCGADLLCSIAVPHLVKQLLGSAKPLHVLPGCCLGGAAFCLFCDLLARSLFAPTELSISSVTAVFGAPVVIWLLVRRNSEREGA